GRDRLERAFVRCAVHSVKWRAVGRGCVAGFACSKAEGKQSLRGTVAAPSPVPESAAPSAREPSIQNSAAEFDGFLDSPLGSGQREFPCQPVTSTSTVRLWPPTWCTPRCTT